MLKPMLVFGIIFNAVLAPAAERQIEYVQLPVPVVYCNFSETVEEVKLPEPEQPVAPTPTKPKMSDFFKPLGPQPLPKPVASAEPDKADQPTRIIPGPISLLPTNLLHANYASGPNHDEHVWETDSRLNIGGKVLQHFSLAIKPKIKALMSVPAQEASKISTRLYSHQVRVLTEYLPENRMLKEGYTAKGDSGEKRKLAPYSNTDQKVSPLVVIAKGSIPVPDEGNKAVAGSVLNVAAGAREYVEKKQYKVTQVHYECRASQTNYGNDMLAKREQLDAWECWEQDPNVKCIIGN